MKNLKKVLAVMTAVTAMAASTSAFAANIAEVSGDVAGTYADGKLSVTTPAAADTTKGDMTLLVLTEGALADEAVADSEILYIDQGTAGFAGLGLKTDVLGAVTAADGHIIKVGYYDANGNFAIAQGYIKVSAEDETVYITWKYGNIDCDANGYMNTEDCYAILNGIVGESVFGKTATFDGFVLGNTYETKDGKTIRYGNIDCDASGYINTDDFYAILNGIVGETSFGDNFEFGEEYQLDAIPVED